jgi:hypothetical protein
VERVILPVHITLALELEHHRENIIQQPEAAYRVPTSSDTKIPGSGVGSIDQRDGGTDRLVQTRQEVRIDVRGERGIRQTRVVRELSGVIVSFQRQRGTASSVVLNDLLRLRLVRITSDVGPSGDDPGQRAILLEDREHNVRRGGVCNQVERCVLGVRCVRRTDHGASRPTRVAWTAVLMKHRYRVVVKRGGWKSERHAHLVIADVACTGGIPSSKGQRPEVEREPISSYTDGIPSVSASVLPNAPCYQKNNALDSRKWLRRTCSRRHPLGSHRQRSSP